MNDRATYMSEESKVVFDSVLVRLDRLEHAVSDHEQRFDTAQTHLWKRFWFWLRWGWPLTDWNAERPNWRPWNRDRRVG